MQLPVTTPAHGKFLRNLIVPSEYSESVCVCMGLCVFVCVVKLCVCVCAMVLTTELPG